MARAEKVLRGLLIESYRTTHVGADLGKGDDAFVGPRQSLGIEVELLWANSDEK